MYMGGGVPGFPLGELVDAVDLHEAIALIEGVRRFIRRVVLVERSSVFTSTRAMP